MKYWNLRPESFGASISDDGSTWQVWIDWVADTSNGPWRRRITTSQAIEDLDATYLLTNRGQATTAIVADGYELQP